MRKIHLELNPTALFIVVIWLSAFAVAHAIGLLTTDKVQILKYQNIVSKESIDYISPQIILGFRCVGFFLLVSGFLFLSSILKLEFKTLEHAPILKWGVLMAIVAGMLYGVLMRIVGNQQGAALLYFFTMLLYLLLIFVEQLNHTTNTFFSSVMLLPLYVIIGYTMGIPAWAKLFGGPAVAERYVQMFQDSFVSKLPGGTSSMIYILGILEMLVPLLLVVSLIKSEFNLCSRKKWLNLAMLLSIFTFGMLCFGLAVLYNFAGSVNLVFYPILTLLVLIGIHKLNQTIKPGP